MFKSVLTACLGAMVFFWSGAAVWPEDMEEHFLNPDFDSSKSIFIDVKDVALVNVLKIISQQSGLSFIASQDVADKRITLYLNKIPLNQALQMILDANGLTYQMQKDTDVFVVKAKEETAKNLITKVYQLKYATVSTSKLNSTITTSASAGGSSSSSSTSGLPSAPSGGGSSSSGAGNTGGLEQVIKDSLSSDGKVIEDTRTNSLIITDKPGQFGIIESTIAKLDVPVPQILIEVEMLDVSKSTADQLGVTYGTTVKFFGAQKAVNYPFSVSTAIPSTSSSGSSSSSSSGSGSSTSSLTAGGFDASGLTAELNFLTTKTDSRTLARPRILTLNNQTARIEITTNQAIDVLPSSVSSGTAGSVQSYTVDRADTGVVLVVTPQADLATREITMAVSPSVKEPVQSLVTTPLGAPIYDVETRASNSLLTLKDGESMIIGGLMISQKNNTIVKLPFLGDLPLVGAAFRSRNTSVQNRELIIFLTPHIIDDHNQSALKGNSSSTSPDAVMQDASDRAQDISNTLNNYEMKSY